MEVILLQPVKKLGNAYSIVTVAPGYANNYLIPNELALPASRENKKQLEHQIAQAEAEAQKNKEAVTEAIEKLNGETISTQQSANEKGGLYAKITSNDVAELLTAKTETRFEPQWINLDDPINEIGTYSIPVSAYNITASVTLSVEAKTPEKNRE